MNNTTSSGSSMNNTVKTESGIGSNTGNTQVLQELFRQHLNQSNQQPQSPSIIHNLHQQHAVYHHQLQPPTTHFLDASHQSMTAQPQTFGDYNLLLNTLVARSHDHVPMQQNSHMVPSEQDFMMQQMMANIQHQQQMIDPIQQHHNSSVSQPLDQMTYNSVTPGNDVYSAQRFEESFFNLLHTQQGSVASNGTASNGATANSDVTDSNMVTDNTHVNDSLPSSSLHPHVPLNSQQWKNQDKTSTFSYFEYDDAPNSADASNHLTIVDLNKFNTMKRPSPPPMPVFPHDNSFGSNMSATTSSSGNMLNQVSSTPTVSPAVSKRLMGENCSSPKATDSPKSRKPTTLSINTNNQSPTVNTTANVVYEQDTSIMNCNCCGRSSAEVSFKKNYSIHEGNIDSYRNTFPHNAEYITSGPVCATCYNKQWRFQRGLYDPQKIRKANPREGLKQKLKDGESCTDSPTTPVLTPVFPQNNRLLAIQQSASPSSPAGSSSSNKNSSKKRKHMGSPRLFDSPNIATNSVTSVDTPDHTLPLHNKRTKTRGGNRHLLPYNPRFALAAKKPYDPNQISIIVQFYQVDKELTGSSISDAINQFNQQQLRIQRQIMFGTHDPNEKQHNFVDHCYSTAMKINIKDFSITATPEKEKTSPIDHNMGRNSLENLRKLLMERLLYHNKTTKVEDPNQGSTSTISNSSEVQGKDDGFSIAAGSSSEANPKLLGLKISTMDRFFNVVLVDLDEFFFVERQFKDGDSLSVFFT